MPKETINLKDKFTREYECLNASQKKAVDRIDGPVLVLAGPGTGKTQLLSVRAANILKKTDVEPENVLILTFTNAGARAMRERLAKIVGNDGYQIEVETFHSFANSIVLESEGAIEFVKEKIQITSVEKVRAIEYLLDNTEGVESLRPFGNPYVHRKEIESRISELKNEGIVPEEFAEEVSKIKADGIRIKEQHLPRLKALALIYREYEKLKNENSSVLFDDRGRIDYDDMILVALEALEKDPALRDSFSAKYRYIMVDEYQDTNGAQLKLLFSMLDDKEQNVCCVGDDDQAIFRFQGATLSNFKVLDEKFPDLVKINLDNNYRSTKEVIETCNSIISKVPTEERMSRKDFVSERSFNSGGIEFTEFLTEEEELSLLIDRIKRLKGVIARDEGLDEDLRARPYNNIAVILRKRDQIITVVDALLKAGIPYATDGEEDIKGEKRVRQMLDVLELSKLDIAGGGDKDLALYNVLSSDYVAADQSDILKIIEYTGRARRKAKRNNEKFDYSSVWSFFVRFMELFGEFKKGNNGKLICPSVQDSKKLAISEKLKLRDPHALHRICWALTRLMKDANTRPVHDVIMKYIEDTALYKFILKRYSDSKVLRIRELRSLVSFVNMIKTADTTDPGLSVNKFAEDLELMKMHGMAVKGELATLSQDGVRVLTAHKSKGLEFYAVFMPFCLEKKSWPVKSKPEVIPIPSEFFQSAERVKEKNRKKLLAFYDELRLFYVASSRAKAHLFYSASPEGKKVTSPFLTDLEIRRTSPAISDEENFLLDYLNNTETDDPLLPAPKVLEDMVRWLTLNPTSLNTFIKCRRKFLYNVVLRLPTKKNQHLVFGNCAHNALEKVYSRYRETGVFPDYRFFRQAFMRHLNYEGVPGALRIWCEARLKKLEEWYDLESKHPVIPIDIEKKLEIKLPGGIVFRGAIDKTEPAGAGAVKVLDYKTGRPYNHIRSIANCRDLSSYECDDYFRQLVSYKFLYDKAFSRKTGLTVKSGVLQFLEPASTSVKKYEMQKGDYIKKELTITEEMTAELSTVIRKTWQNIQRLDFEKLPERETSGASRCSRCDYDSLCWKR